MEDLGHYFFVCPFCPFLFFLFLFQDCKGINGRSFIIVSQVFEDYSSFSLHFFCPSDLIISINLSLGSLFFFFFCQFTFDVEPSGGLFIKVIGLFNPRVFTKEQFPSLYSSVRLFHAFLCVFRHGSFRSSSIFRTFD